MKKIKYLDKEEQNLIESLERDNWKSVKDLTKWKSHLSKTASNTLTKDKFIKVMQE